MSTGIVVQFRAAVQRRTHLKPCPFCGGRDIKILEESGPNSVRHVVECACLVAVPGPRRYDAKGIDPGAHIRSQADAIKRWNTRHTTGGAA